jgi:molybdate transport repressor ModE-like protein
MIWDDLRLLLAVCREGTLAGAARALGVNQSTVFRRVRSIEDGLGVQLFERLPGGYTMTEAGEAVMQAGEQVEREFLRLSRELVGRDSRLRGALRITAPDALVIKLFLPHLARFCKAFPEITVELCATNNYLNLSRREADIAIRSTNAPPASMAGRRLCRVATTLYASANYLAGQSDSAMENHAWLMPDDELYHLPANAWLKHHYPCASIRFRSNTLLGLYEAARNSLGVAPLPCFLADSEPLLERVIPPPDDLASSLWLLTHPDLRHTARVRAFMDFFAESLRDDMSLLEGHPPSHRPHPK